MHPQSPENINTSRNTWDQQASESVAFTPQHPAAPHRPTPQPAHNPQPFYSQQPQQQPTQPITPRPQHPAAPVEQPPANPLGRTELDSVVPIPVVQVLSPRGVEYVMLTFALFTAAIGLAAVLVCLVYGQTGMMSLSLPVSLMIVGVPIFAALFLRLKKAELRDPNLKLDQSKRRSTQATQIIAFLVILVTLVTTVVSVFAAISGAGGSVAKSLASAFFILVVFGGILAYYWHDERKA